MFGNVIVATDLQPTTRMSLRTACDLLRTDGQVVLVHVIRRIPGLLDADAAEVYDRLKAVSGARMLELTTWFTRERGVDVAYLTLVGSPGQEIARLAAERGSDLVVLAHDPVDDPATLGSVSYQVAHLAPCAVLVLKPEPLLKASRRRAARVSGARGPRSSGARRDSRRSRR